MSQFPTTPLLHCSLTQLNWLEGAWQGAVGVDRIDEYWSTLSGATLMGMFRWLRGDRVRFFEFMTLASEGDEIIFRIKHFHPGLVGWEDKDHSIEFALVQLDRQKAVFLQRQVPDPPWMIYRCEGQDTLVSYFQRTGEEVAEHDKFRAIRQQL